ncbi:GNAT family N-acetyltransferase [Desulfotignum balticum]|uniref:GNAT family N-acetyltransferase n=1 Tax=Desulfotignum balticum TaxID=115781 RepID=UPI0003FA6876|nr:GNAT family N-acetyltransferase [Desulfotignum balticum]
MIRPFNRTDLHTLHRMICETIEASYSGVYPPRAVGFFKEHHSERKIVERSSAGKILVLISERDDCILATGALIGSDITGVFVRHAHQRQGYGEAIMNRLEQMAKENGISKLTLSISLPSRQFYERLGYKVLDERVINVGEGEFLKYWSGEKALNPQSEHKVGMETVETVRTAKDIAELDELLWRVLWRPIGLPSDIRNNFSINGEKIELAVKEKGQIVGGLVAVWTSEKEIELRHLAVNPDCQREGIGQSLVAKLFSVASAKPLHRVHTIARNASVSFFRKIGFQTASGTPPEHPIFMKHGITFELMEKIVGQDGELDVAARRQLP